MKEKTTAGILALLVGTFGIHKFYLGKTGTGIIYILLFWTIIPTILSFIEGIKYLTMSQYDFDLKYNRDYMDVPEPRRFASEGTKRDISKELEKLHELKEKGIITEDEFLDRKEVLLYG